MRSTATGALPSRSRSAAATRGRVHARAQRPRRPGTAPLARRLRVAAILENTAAPELDVVGDVAEVAQPVAQQPATGRANMLIGACARAGGGGSDKGANQLSPRATQPKRWRVPPSSRRCASVRAQGGACSAWGTRGGGRWDAIAPRRGDRAAVLAPRCPPLLTQQGAAAAAAWSSRTRRNRREIRAPRGRSGVHIECRRQHAARRGGREKASCAPPRGGAYSRRAGRRCL